MHKTFLGKVYNLVSNPPCEVEMEAASPPLSAQFDKQEKKIVIERHLSRFSK